MLFKDSPELKLRILLSKQSVEMTNFIKEAQMLFKKSFASPSEERSMLKNIPISMLDDFKLVFGTGFRIKFRGSSKAGYVRPQAFIHKEFADSFAVYKK